MNHDIAKAQEGRLTGMAQLVEEKRLSKDQKQKLLEAVRYSFLKHQELMTLGNKPNFETARPLIMQGLSYRLDPFEQSKEKQYTLKLDKRINYDKTMEQNLIDDHAKSRQAETSVEIKKETQKMI